MADLPGIREASDKLSDNDSRQRRTQREVPRPRYSADRPVRPAPPPALGSTKVRVNRQGHWHRSSKVNNQPHGGPGCISGSAWISALQCPISAPLFLGGDRVDRIGTRREPMVLAHCLGRRWHADRRACAGQRLPARAWRPGPVGWLGVGLPWLAGVLVVF
jgi:hypothetical protein